MPAARSPEGVPAQKPMAGRDPELKKAMTALDARIDAEDKLAETRRKAMITPAPADFKPEPADRKIRLRLILEKNVLRAGEYPRFRLELTNVGSKPINYQENRPSMFLRNATLVDTNVMHFYLTTGRTERAELLPMMYGRPPKPASDRPSRPGMSEAEWKKRLNDPGSQAEQNFDVRLLPGETLHNIGDDGSLSGFTTLYAKGGFKKPGTYRLQVEIDDRPEPLTDEDIQAASSYWTPQQSRDFHEEQVRNALGPVVSNTATFEVTR